MSPVDLKSNNDAGLLGVFTDIRPKLLRFVCARTGNAALAEDIVQDIAVKLAENATGPVANPSAFFHRMANNLLIDRAREMRARSNREEAWTDQETSLANGEAVEQAPSPERVLLARDELTKVLTAIDALPAAAAQVFRMHRIEGLSHPEIAASLGISRSAVEKSMAVALKNLRKALET